MLPVVTDSRGHEKYWLRNENCSSERAKHPVWQAICHVMGLGLDRLPAPTASWPKTQRNLTSSQRRSEQTGTKLRRKDMKKNCWSESWLCLNTGAHPQQSQRSLRKLFSSQVSLSNVSMILYWHTGPVAKPVHRTQALVASGGVLHQKRRENHLKTQMSAYILFWGVSYFNSHHLREQWKQIVYSLFSWSSLFYRERLICNTGNNAEWNNVFFLSS